MTDTISIRAYQPADLGAVLELLRISLGESEVNRRTPELFSWKHSTILSALRSCSWPRTTSGSSDFGLSCAGNSSPSMANGSAASARSTPPPTRRAQRRGIFRSLTLEAVEIARGEGVDLIFNTPNPRSKAGYLTMGWAEVGRDRCSIAAQVRRSVWPQAGCSVRARLRYRGTDQIITDRPPLGLRTPRTPQYLRWRFRHPFAGYVVTGNADGLAVLRPNNRKGRKELVVSDLLGRAQASALRQAARVTDADYLVGWFRRGAPERHHTRTAGMVPLPGMRASTLWPAPCAKTWPGSLTDLRRWDLALSDLELL